MYITHCRLYQCIKQPESTLVFEDLGQLGYMMASRELGLDEEHCRLVMERLGEFHATSMALALLVSSSRQKTMGKLNSNSTGSAHL